MDIAKTAHNFASKLGMEQKGIEIPAGFLPNHLSDDISTVNLPTTGAWGYVRPEPVVSDAVLGQLSASGCSFMVPQHVVEAPMRYAMWLHGGAGDPKVVRGNLSEEEARAAVAKLFAASTQHNAIVKLPDLSTLAADER